jgi:hypothetical protein
MSKKMKKNKKDYFPDFSGKCLSISIRDDSTSHDVCDPHFEFQGERLFIIGTVPCGATASDWCENKTVAIAWIEYLSITFLMISKTMKKQ